MCAYKLALQIRAQDLHALLWMLVITALPQVARDIAHAQFNDDLHWSGTLEPNISKTLGDRGSVPMEHQ